MSDTKEVNGRFVPVWPSDDGYDEYFECNIAHGVPVSATVCNSFDSFRNEMDYCEDMIKEARAAEFSVSVGEVKSGPGPISKGDIGHTALIASVDLPGQGLGRMKGEELDGFAATIGGVLTTKEDIEYFRAKMNTVCESKKPARRKLKASWIVESGDDMRVRYNIPFSTTSVTMKLNNGTIIEAPNPGEGWTREEVTFHNYPHGKEYSDVNDCCRPELAGHMFGHEEGKMFFEEYHDRCMYEGAKILSTAKWSKPRKPRDVYYVDTSESPKRSKFWVEDHKVVFEKKKEDTTDCYPGAEKRLQAGEWSGVWMEGHAPPMKVFK